MKNMKIAIAALVMIGGFACTPCMAAGSWEERSVFQHDVSYEQALKYEASADKVMTPAKALRWIRGLSGQTVSAPSSTEFQPTVHVHDSNVRIIAAIAYKF